MTRFVRLGALLTALVVTVLLAGCSSGGDDRRAGLPADFPAEQVPLVDGQIIASAGSGDQWTLTVQAPANAGNPLDGAVRKLTDDGYQENGRDTAGGQTVVRLSSTKDQRTYWVTVGVSPVAAGGPTSLFYQVSTG
ncbi:hypothetical protein GYA93_22600 [Gordonia desulfuricans]|uniref:Uncharacterized protein n=1 Tax=Gordonia desulfuricans TaxID=89051 RepID=A0A7K3LW42_9ACTN|nr:MULTISPECIES: hypothetical protein [Gordonia]NDK92326.1 hypothetical protein [Gordonia desulfuricans]WLP92353.1 hypothetical protein Q9K23_09060 [Gordonia sp. NB41Y]